MKKFFAGGILGVLATCGAPAQTSPTMPVAAQQALVNKYCAGCHNDKLKSGGFSWLKIDLAHPDQQSEQVEKAIRKVRAGMLPPSGILRPAAATARSFANAIDSNPKNVLRDRP